MSALEAFLQLSEKPSVRATERPVSQPFVIHGQGTVQANWIVVEARLDEATSAEEQRHEMLGHPAPAQTGKKEVETAIDVDEAPDPRADDAVRRPFLWIGTET